MTVCEKYEEWLTDAALGTLAPRRERELLAHACACEACREAYQHAREVVVRLDRGVESFVSGQPSPGFEAHLRARIADQPRRFVRWTWKPAMTAAVLAALITAILVGHERPRQLHALAIHTDSRAGLDRRAVASQPPGDNSRPLMAKATPLPAPRFRPYRASRYPSVPTQPEVLVQSGQLAAIVQFAKAVNAGRIDGKALLAAQEGFAAPLEVKPLEIRPLEVTESDSTSQTGGEPGHR